MRVKDGRLDGAYVSGDMQEKSEKIRKLVEDNKVVYNSRGLECKNKR